MIFNFKNFLRNQLSTLFCNGPKNPAVGLLKGLGSVFDSTWVVVGLLAPSDFTSSRGASFLTFVTHLQKTHVELSVFQHILGNTKRVGMSLRTPASFTSLCPRITSSFTSSTENPNRSSNSGVFLQQSPEANSCPTGQRSRVRNTKWKNQRSRNNRNQNKSNQNERTWLSLC